MDGLGAGIGFVTITNAGSGPALEVDASLEFKGLDQRVIGFHLVVVGEKHQFMAHGKNGELLRLDELTEAAPIVTLIGKMRDVFDNEIDVDESFDLGEQWDRLKISEQRLPPDQEKRIADELEKVRTALQRIQSRADSAYDRVWPSHETAAPPDADVAGE